MIKEVVGRDPEVIKAILSAMEKEEDVTKFVRGFVHEICGELTAFVCNLPWEDVRKSLIELVDDDKSKEILMSDKAEKWWNNLVEQSKVYLNALLEQAKQYVFGQGEEEEDEEETEEETAQEPKSNGPF